MNWWRKLRDSVQAEFYRDRAPRWSFPPGDGQGPIRLRSVFGT